MTSSPVLEKCQRFQVRQRPSRGAACQRIKHCDCPLDKPGIHVRIYYEAISFNTLSLGTNGGAVLQRKRSCSGLAATPQLALRLHVFLFPFMAFQRWRSLFGCRGDYITSAQTEDEDKVNEGAQGRFFNEKLKD